MSSVVSNVQPGSPISRRVPATLQAVLIIGDLIALGLAHYTALYMPEWLATLGIEADGKAALDQQRMYTYGLVSLLVLGMMMNKGVYTQRMPWWAQVQCIFKSVVLAFLIDGFTYFTLQLPSPRLIILSTWVFVAVYMICLRRLSLWFVSQAPSWKLPTVIIGDATTILDTLNALDADGLTGYQVKQVLLRDKEDRELDFNALPAHQREVEVLDGNKHCDAFIHTQPDCFYIVSLDGFRGQQRDKLMQSLEESGAEYAIIPPIKRLHLHGMDPHYFFGNDIMLLHKRQRIASPIGRLLKRLMDMLATVFALPLIGLIALVVFIAKKIEGSPSPVFYGGQRVGMGGALFPCWKFCTMRPDADAILSEVLAADPEKQHEWDTFQKLKDDPRVDSRISQFLRKTSLDELPQLWNVFRGDMSLVGPRPILPEQREDYGDALKHYESTRPGLTGLWQVSGRNETSFSQRIVWDCWYVRNWSLWHDAIILIKTVKVLFTGSGAY